MRYLSLAVLSGAFSGLAHAAKPTDGGLGFQPAATELARDAFAFHDSFLLWMCILITLFVLGLLIWVMVRYNAKANPVPSKTTHNTAIEIIWTAAPVAILIAISVISFPLLYKIDREPDLKAIAAGEVTDDVAIQAAAEAGWVNVKAIGNQWNWTYVYSDIEASDGAPVEFPSNGLHKGLSSDATYGELNLSVDYPMVVPAGRYIRYYTAASDVIHAFTVPAFGIKTDAIPGRLNEGWFKADEPGVYYGQCSELCGKDHAYMPIEVRVVPQAQFDAWVDLMKQSDWEAAAQLVAEIQPLEEPLTRLAAAQ